MLPGFSQDYLTNEPFADTEFVRQLAMCRASARIPLANPGHLRFGQLGVGVFAATSRSRQCRRAAPRNILGLSTPPQIAHVVIAGIAVQMIADQAGRARPDERIQNQDMHVAGLWLAEETETDHLIAVEMGARLEHEGCPASFPGKRAHPPMITDFVTTLVVLDCLPFFDMIVLSHVVSSIAGDDSVRADRRESRRSVRTIILCAPRGGQAQ